MLGIINRTKAVFAGRRGQPLLQTYYDLAKLLRKGAVYSRTTTWIFRAGPIVGLAAALIAATLVPLGNFPALIAFPADFFFFAGLLGAGAILHRLGRARHRLALRRHGRQPRSLFLRAGRTCPAGGLGHPRPTGGRLSLSAIFPAVAGAHWLDAGPVMALVLMALMIVLLAENARIPVDDPNTHLELTMIHEVMVLDHGGPDLAFILYGAALKLWLFAALIVAMVLPDTGTGALNLLFSAVGIFAIAVIVGVVESVMARLRLLIVPQLLVGAGALAGMAFLLGMR